MAGVLLWLLGVPLSVIVLVRRDIRASSEPPGRIVPVSKTIQGR